MGNVDGVPIASQMKSAVQAAHGDSDAAWETQRRFSEKCIGAAQVRSAVQAAGGDLQAAAETQRRFMANAHNLLDGSEIADTVPGLSQFKSVTSAVDGDVHAAVETQRNFTKRCPVVSQVRSAVEAVQEGPETALATQGEFLRFASASLDKVPLLGHAKGWVHHQIGDHERGAEATRAADQSTARTSILINAAVNDILQSPSSSSADANSPASAPAEPLSTEMLREHTVRFCVTEDQCTSHKACPICMMDFAVGEEALTLRCFHIFHSHCAGRWLQQSGNCPVCRVAAVPTPT